MFIEAVRDDLRAAIEGAPTGLVMVDRHGNIALLSAPVEQLFGYARAELVGEPVEILLPARFRHQHAGYRNGFLQAPEFRPMGIGRDLFGLHCDGREIPVEIGLSPLHTDNGHYVLAAIVDITDRKRSEQALRDSEERLRMAQQVARIGTFDWNVETGDNNWTPELEQMHGLPAGSFTWSGWERAIHPEDRALAVQTLTRVFDGDAPTEAEWRVVWPDGTVHWLAARWKVFKSAAGKPLRVTGINIDLTERKATEHERESLVAQLSAANAHLEDHVQSRTVQLTTALKEREILLQEIHHRVKNNLQVISSLINMQARRLDDGASRSALEECKTRVEAIALIHEKLYQSQDYARVPFSDYARSLASNIFHATGVSPANVALGMEIEHVLLPVDKAIPCGLILNELISNALKHGFPDDRRGSLRVGLRNTTAHGIELSVSDDGVGMERDFDPRTSSSLGMQLVTTLVEQIGGRLEVERKDGMTFRISFQLGTESPDSTRGR